MKGEVAPSAHWMTPDRAENSTWVDPRSWRPVIPGGEAYWIATDAYADGVSLDEAKAVIGVVGDPGEWGELQANLDAIREQYGLRVRLQRVPFDLTPLEAAAQGRETDVYVLGGPDIAEAAAARPLLDVRDFIGETQLIEDSGSYLVSLSRIGSDGTWPSDTGPVHGVFTAANSKAVVWTREPKFTNFGCRALSDWASILGLADEIVADRRTPFCLGIESGGSADAGRRRTGWRWSCYAPPAPPSTTPGRNTTLPFDHPVVVEAIRTVGEMVHRPGFLDVEPDAAALRNWADALLDLTEQPRSCLMTPFPSFMPAAIGPDAELSVGGFPFPTFRSEFDDAVVGAGTSPSPSPTAPRSAA